MKQTLFGFALGAVLLSCTTTPEGPPVVAPAHPIQAYFPLAVGNSWTYVTRFGGKAEENTVRIEKQEGGYFRDNHRGVLAFDATGLRDEKRYLLQSPVLPGTSWRSVIDVGKTELYEIIAVDETVTVPAGTFSEVVLVRCRTKVDATTDLEILWAYAPKIGLVRFETTAVIGGKERQRQLLNELKSFHLQ